MDDFALWKQSPEKAAREAKDKELRDKYEAFRASQGKPKGASAATGSGGQGGEDASVPVEPKQRGTGRSFEQIVNDAKKEAVMNYGLELEAGTAATLKAKRAAEVAAIPNARLKLEKEFAARRESDAAVAKSRQDKLKLISETKIEEQGMEEGIKTLQKLAEGFNDDITNERLLAAQKRLLASPKFREEYLAKANEEIAANIKKLHLSWMGNTTPLGKDSPEWQALKKYGLSDQEIEVEASKGTGIESDYITQFGPAVVASIPAAIGLTGAALNATPIVGAAMRGAKEAVSLGITAAQSKGVVAGISAAANYAAQHPGVADAADFVLQLATDGLMTLPRDQVGKAFAEIAKEFGSAKAGVIAEQLTKSNLSVEEILLANAVEPKTAAAIEKLGVTKLTPVQKEIKDAANPLLRSDLVDADKWTAGKLGGSRDAVLPGVEKRDIRGLRMRAREELEGARLEAKGIVQEPKSSGRGIASQFKRTAENYKKDPMARQGTTQLPESKPKEESVPVIEPDPPSFAKGSTGGRRLAKATEELAAAKTPEAKEAAQKKIDALMTDPAVQAELRANDRRRQLVKDIKEAAAAGDGAKVAQLTEELNRAVVVPEKAAATEAVETPLAPDEAFAQKYRMTEVGRMARAKPDNEFLDSVGLTKEVIAKNSNKTPERIMRDVLGEDISRYTAEEQRQIAQWVKNRQPKVAAPMAPAEAAAPAPKKVIAAFQKAPKAAKPVEPPAPKPAEVPKSTKAEDATLPDMGPSKAPEYPAFKKPEVPKPEAAKPPEPKPTVPSLFKKKPVKPLNNEQISEIMERAKGVKGKIQMERPDMFHFERGTKHAEELIYKRAGEIHARYPKGTKISEMKDIDADELVRLKDELDLLKEKGALLAEENSMLSFVSEGRAKAARDAMVEKALSAADKGKLDKVADTIIERTGISRDAMDYLAATTDFLSLNLTKKINDAARFKSFEQVARERGYSGAEIRQLWKDAWRWTEMTRDYEKLPMRAQSVFVEREKRAARLAEIEKLLSEPIDVKKYRAEITQPEGLFNPREYYKKVDEAAAAAGKPAEVADTASKITRGIQAFAAVPTLATADDLPDDEDNETLNTVTKLALGVAAAGSLALIGEKRLKKAYQAVSHYITRGARFKPPVYRASLAKVMALPAPTPTPAAKLAFTADDFGKVLGGMDPRAPDAIMPKLVDAIDHGAIPMRKAMEDMKETIYKAVSGLTKEEDLAIRLRVDGAIDAAGNPTAHGRSTYSLTNRMRFTPGLEDRAKVLREVLDKAYSLKWGNNRAHYRNNYFTWLNSNSSHIQNPNARNNLMSLASRFWNQRTGTAGMADLSTAEVMDTYVNSVMRNAYLSEPISAATKALNTFAKNGGLDKKQAAYVQAYLDMAAGGSGKPGALEAFITRNLYRGTLWGNAASALINTTQLINIAADVGLKHTAAGVAKMFNPFGKGWSEAREKGALELLDTEWMHSLRLMPKPAQRFMRSLDKVMMSPMIATESINRAVTFYAAHSEATALGKTGADAVEYALSKVNRTMFNTSSSNVAPVFANSSIGRMARVLTQFPVRQTTFVGGLAADAVKGIKAGDMQKVLPFLRYVGLTAAVISGMKMAGLDWGAAVDWAPGFNIARDGAEGGAGTKVRVPLMNPIMKTLAAAIEGDPKKFIERASIFLPGMVAINRFVENKGALGRGYLDENDQTASKKIAGIYDRVRSGEDKRKPDPRPEVREYVDDAEVWKRMLGLQTEQEHAFHSTRKQIENVNARESRKNITREEVAELDNQRVPRPPGRPDAIDRAFRGLGRGKRLVLPAVNEWRKRRTE